MSFNMFDGADESRWLTAVEKALGGKPIEALTSKSRDALDIHPLYQSETVRGLSSRQAAQPWAIVQRVDDPNLGRAGAQIADDLSNGASGLAFVSSSSPHAHGAGLPNLDKDTWVTLLKDVFLDMISIRIEAGLHVSSAAEGFISALAEKGVDREKVNVSVGFDPIGAGFAVGDADAARSSLSALDELLLPLSKAQFSGKTLAADGRIYHANGASEAQELAAVLATAVAYLRELEAHAVPPVDALRLMEICLAADADQFLNIAKFRAARVLWDKLGESVGSPSCEATIHAETAWRMMTQRDAQVNMLRATMACFAAGVGGANSVTVLPYTTVLGLPDGFARRIARNTQLILLEESNLSHVSDPAAGSGAMESLTTSLAAEAWQLFQEIEGRGGMMEALASGWYQERILAVCNARDHDIAKGKEPITGTSTFPLLDEPSVEVLAPTAQMPGLVHPDLALNPKRASEQFEALRDAADRVATETGKRPTVFLATIGTQAEFTPRLTFMQNFLAAGGIGASTSGAVSSPAEAAAAFTQSGCALVCVCSTDEQYESIGVDVVSALIAAGATGVFLAGKPGPMADSLNGVGLTGSYSMGVDMVTALKDLHARLETAQ